MWQKDSATDFSPNLDKEAHAVYEWGELSSISSIYLCKFIYTVSGMKRAILLQIDDVTVKKGKILKDFSLKATAEFNRLWDERDFCNTFMDFHRKTFADIPGISMFNAHLAIVGICIVSRLCLGLKP